MFAVVRIWFSYCLHVVMLSPGVSQHFVLVALSKSIISIVLSNLRHVLFSYFGEHIIAVSAAVFVMVVTYCYVLLFLCHFVTYVP